MFPASASRSRLLSDRLMDWPGHPYLMFAASYAIALGLGLWQNPTPDPLWTVLVDSVLGMVLLLPLVLVCYCTSVFLICLACAAYEAIAPAGVRPSLRRSTVWPSEPLSDRFMDWPGHPYLMLIVSYATALGLMLWPDSSEFPLWVALVASVPLMVVVAPFALVCYCISAFLIGLAFVVYEAMRAPLPD